MRLRTTSFCGLAVLLAIALPLPASASIKGNEASMALIDAGNALYQQGQYQQAVDKFSAAAKADPAASLPLSSIANLLAQLANKASGEARSKLHQQAEGAARAALRIEAQDPIAQEVLRLLLDDQPVPHMHATTTPEAAALFQAGEASFQRGDIAGALKQYEQALQLDPLLASAWLSAGDCYYVQKNWVEAETRFRKAVELEPLDAQAWRFLSDVLLAQGKDKAADQALLSGIGAQPSQLPNWDKLAYLRARAGQPLKALKLQPKGGVMRDPASGKWTVNFDPGTPATQNTADNAIWLSFNLATVGTREKNLTLKPALSTYQMDLQAWRTALAVLGELQAKPDATPPAPALQAMQTLAKAQQLEAALFLLTYKESYRPDFEAWKLAHPDGVATFIASTGLRP